MRDLSLTLSNSFTKKKTKTSVSTYRFNLAIITATAILGLGYLVIVNNLGTKGYEIRKLEQSIRSLEADQKGLQLQVSDLQSINRIQAEVEQLNFVPVKNVTYLKEADFALK